MRKTAPNIRRKGGAPVALALALLSFLTPWPAHAADGRLERVLTEKKLRVCVWPDYYGISYRNPKTQALSGIDIDMAKALGNDLGVVVEFVDSSFARLIADVTGDRCDVAMFAIGINP